MIHQRGNRFDSRHWECYTFLPCPINQSGEGKIKKKSNKKMTQIDTARGPGREAISRLLEIYKVSVGMVNTQSVDFPYHATFREKSVTIGIDGQA